MARIYGDPVPARRACRSADVFCGRADNGLTAMLVVRHDGHEELKLLWNTSRDEVEAARALLADDMPVEVVWR
jgi:hypothetical protein